MPQHNGKNGGSGFDFEDRVQRATDRLKKTMPSGPSAAVLVAGLVLSTESDLFKFLKGMTPNVRAKRRVRKARSVASR